MSRYPSGVAIFIRAAILFYPCISMRLAPCLLAWLATMAQGEGLRLQTSMNSAASPPGPPINDQGLRPQTIGAGLN